MKIAILTLPIGHNYGGIMQAYALQKLMRDMGNEVIIVDYHRQLRERSFFYKRARIAYRLLQKVTGKRKAAVNFESHSKFFIQDNQRFIDANIVQSEYIDNVHGLKNHFKINNYDAVIVGSDQTWRPKYSPNIYSYYLDFLGDNRSIKRIAYASSFGVDDWEYSVEETIKCANLASLFDAISVRERSGTELCKKYLGVNSEFTLDPTLLLEKADYIGLITNEYKQGDGNGVFTYVLDNNAEKIAAAKYVADSLHTHTYKCQPKRKLSDLGSSNLNDYKMPALQKWIASFANAEFVVTDSFHGMVFSIIFEKPFLVIVNEKRGAARFESLLKQLGGLDHLVYDPTSINRDKVEIKNIKPLSKKKLLPLKQESIEFLVRNLQ